MIKSTRLYVLDSIFKREYYITIQANRVNYCEISDWLNFNRTYETANSTACIQIHNCTSCGCLDLCTIRNVLLQQTDFKLKFANDSSYFLRIMILQNAADRLCQLCNFNALNAAECIKHITVNDCWCAFTQ